MASNLYLYSGTITNGVFTITASYEDNGPVYSVGPDNSGDGILQPQEEFSTLVNGNPFVTTYLGAVSGGIALSQFGDQYIIVSQTGLQVGATLAVLETNYDPANPPIIPCFLAGTLVRTARGEVAVEELTLDDQLVTLSGRLAPLVWIGHRKLSPRLIAAAPEKSLPVRFLAGCLAPGLPARDLWLSPDHCLHHDGVLVQAKTLINGTTVTQKDPGRSIVYYHLLLDRHDVVLAEGAGAESYRPCNNIFGFHNAETFPQDVERNQPRATGCFPVKKSGAKFEALQALLLANCDASEPAVDLVA